MTEHGRLIDGDEFWKKLTSTYDEPPSWSEIWNVIEYMHTIEPERDQPEHVLYELERDMPKRVLWTGWKGYRYTRYKCPNCKKPVRNDDVYCHRCGQKLMFPHIYFTPYVPGEVQKEIVKWPDEEDK